MNVRKGFSIAAQRDATQKRIAEDQALLRKAAKIRDEEARQQSERDVHDRREKLERKEAENKRMLEQKYHAELKRHGDFKAKIENKMKGVPGKTPEQQRKELRASVSAQYGPPLEAEYQKLEQESKKLIEDQMEQQLQREQERGDQAPAQDKLSWFKSNKPTITKEPLRQSWDKSNDRDGGRER